MITKENTYKQAFENKTRRLKEKQAQREMLLSAAYNANPRLSEIDRELSAAGAQVAITALSGDTKKLATLKKHTKALSAEKELLLKNASA